MKPLPVVPLTQEDERIFALWNLARFLRYGTCGGLVSHYAPADRRDAALMLEAQQWRDTLRPVVCRELRGILISGALPGAFA